MSTRNEGMILVYVRIESKNKDLISLKLIIFCLNALYTIRWDEMLIIKKIIIMVLMGVLM